MLKFLFRIRELLWNKESVELELRKCYMQGYSKIIEIVGVFLDPKIYVAFC